MFTCSFLLRNSARNSGLSTSRYLKTLTATALFALISALHASAQVEYVDPTIGNIGILLVPTRPAVYLPNSMIRVYPIREDAADDQTESFPLTIGSHRQQELFSIMPGDGKPAAYDQEHTTPYYYSTRFDDSLITTEFTTAARAGYFRFTFPQGSAQVVVGNREPGLLHAEGTTVSGEEDFEGMKAYVFGEFNAPMTFTIDQVKGRTRITASMKDRQDSKALEFRYGISFISVEQARKNLQSEIPDWNFDRVRDEARAMWNKRLGQIEIEGGTEAQRKVFYTALYRCSERMINITEDGQYYSAYDHNVHQDSRPFYVDNWLWDTYRALEPLQTLLSPQMEADKMQSYVRMYEQSGIMPTFSLLTGPIAGRNGRRQSRGAMVRGCVVQGRAQLRYREGLRRRSQAIA